MVKLNILVGVALLGFFCSQTAPVEASTMTLVDADVSYDVDLALASMDPNSEAALLYKSKRAKAKKQIKRGVKHAVHDIDKGKKSALKHMNREIKSAKKHDQDEKEEYMKMGRGYVKTYMNEAKDYVKSGAKHGIDAVNNYGELENAIEPQQAPSLDSSHEMIHTSSASPHYLEPSTPTLSSPELSSGHRADTSHMEVILFHRQRTMGTLSSVNSSVPSSSSFYSHAIPHTVTHTTRSSTFTRVDDSLRYQNGDLIPTIEERESQTPPHGILRPRSPTRTHLSRSGPVTIPASTTENLVPFVNELAALIAMFGSEAVLTGREYLKNDTFSYISRDFDDILFHIRWTREILLRFAPSEEMPLMYPVAQEHAKVIREIWKDLRAVRTASQKEQKELKKKTEKSTWKAKEAVLRALRLPLTMFSRGKPVPENTPTRVYEIVRINSLLSAIRPLLRRLEELQVDYDEISEKTKEEKEYELGTYVALEEDAKTENGGLSDLTATNLATTVSDRLIMRRALLRVGARHGSVASPELVEKIRTGQSVDGLDGKNEDDEKDPNEGVKDEDEL